ncbi:hypothetical protein DACRYDRAFT_107255 [Dacryopinax primogenitus]|uniref:Uncharacterized protein n=1 Tax=Dacryopinax primogenitus (strain DJM 731) TaxID=1858805 RepID=M5G0Q5_DACPD|nr:uncharacterized protein DACRYDRAFT_107255 [Dacryopinax primogenitus]EJU02329.1 hypothetical protein DACRYDRAFT_107255 [Dacryopinax primogenitus]
MVGVDWVPSRSTPLFVVRLVHITFISLITWGNVIMFGPSSGRWSNVDKDTLVNINIHHKLNREDLARLENWRAEFGFAVSSSKAFIVKQGQIWIKLLMVGGVHSSQAEVMGMKYEAEGFLH